MNACHLPHSKCKIELTFNNLHHYLLFIIYMLRKKKKCVGFDFVDNSSGFIFGEANCRKDSTPPIYVLRYVEKTGHSFTVCTHCNTQST
jgi:hypothetical protein